MLNPYIWAVGQRRGSDCMKGTGREVPQGGGKEEKEKCLFICSMRPKYLINLQLTTNY